jgi:hypothetical protein
MSGLLDCLAVIASQRVGAMRRPMVNSAKQSSVSALNLDCFVALLLAMTKRGAYSPTSFSQSSSVSTVTPYFLASASFEPAPGPATT